MTGMNLTQAEANELIESEKVRTDDTEWLWPHRGGKLHIPLISVDKKERFFLDIVRGRISLNKYTFQNRARKAVVLIRLDIEGAPHQNPDGEELGPTHLHIYREGFADKWAIPIPKGKFPHIDDPFLALCEDFMGFCNIIEPPLINKVLFNDD